MIYSQTMMMMIYHSKTQTMEVQGKAILILPDKLEEKTSKGVILNEAVTEPPKKGLVIQAGPGCEQVRAGDRVQYHRKGASIIEVDDVEHHFIIEDQVFYIE